MALDFSKLNFFSRLDARARVFVLFGGVLGLLLLVYMGTKWLSGGSTAIGPSRVAGAPQGLKSIPGGQLTPEYYRALAQANAQAAQQAKMTGGSAVPTLLNIGGQPVASSPGQCNIICSDQMANVKSILDEWVKQGKLAPELATALEGLADKNGSVDEYANELDQLVRQGKLTPEQARELLEQYKKQHTNSLLLDSAKTMDSMIKANQLPLDIANQLLAAQKSGVSPADYAAILQKMVAAGKISPTTAQRLLAQYSQQYAKEITMQSIAWLQQLARDGQISPEVEKRLIELENQGAAINVVAETLQKYVAAGKLIPAVSARILEQYNREKAAIGTPGVLSQLLQQGEAQLDADLNDFMKAGKVSPDAASQLHDMAQNDASLEDFTAAVNGLVAKGKISKDAANRLIGDYTSLKQRRTLAQRLAALQANNASPVAYADALKAAVQAGLITPDQAAQLMQQYAAMTSKEITGQTALSQTVANAAPGTPTPNQFTAAETQTAQRAAQDEQARIEAIMSAMSNQAQQLIVSWQPPAMSHKEGTPAVSAASESNVSGAVNKASSNSPFGAAGQPAGPPLIKAGSIIFAVLDTAVNSDYPDSPVLATIVDGPFKGAKMLGKLTTTKGVSGQLDRVSLNFSLMNLDAWSSSKAVTAFAIDPDTARTVLASQVNYHYMKRFGAIMATSFLQGYANAVNSSASTSTTGIFGTSTTHPQLSPSNKLLVALGQMGQTLGTATQNYINTPPTVKVDSGVSLGILFMADVS